MLYPIAYNSDGEIIAWIEYTTTIKKDSFHNIKSDEFTEVVIPDFVEVIGERAFCARGVQKLTLNNGLKRIECYSFWDNKITKIKLPNTLEYIGEWALSCNEIEKLVIPDSVTFIGDSAFWMGWDFHPKEGKLGKDLKYIDSLWGLNVENLTMSDNIKSVTYSNTFKWTVMVRELNLVDISLSYFIYFGKHLKRDFPRLENVNIKFKSKLNFIQKLIFNKYDNKLYYDVSVNINYKEKNEKIEEKNFKKEVTEDKEINDLVNEIEKKLLDYKSNFVDEIKEIINDLIDRYKDSITNSKPKLDLKKKKETELSFDSKNVKITRLELIKSLQDILLILNEKKDLFIYLDKLDGYLNNTIDDEIANKIKEIYNIGDILEDNTLVNKINNIVNKTRKDIKNNILGAIKSGINVEYKNNLEIEINSLYEEYQGLLDTVKPYMDLLNILENNGDEARISKDILDLELVISTLDKNSKEKFSKLLEDIKTYFINILKENTNKIKNHEEYISLIDIELLVRKRLDTILQELANTNYMTILFDDLDNHVNDGIEYLGGNELSDNSSITSIIEDIYKAIGNFSESEKEMIIAEIQVILKKFKKMLNNKNKYNKLINKYREEHQDMILPNDISILELILLNELMNILLNVQEYKNDLEEYTSLSNKSVNKL